MPLRITITGDGQARILETAEAVRPANILPVAGRAVANKVRAHLQELQDTRPNKEGFHRENWWSQVRRSVQNPVAEGDNAVRISINKPGFALRLFGGVVTPVNKQALTIPATDEAYGKSATEFSNLVLRRVINPRTGRLQAALVEVTGAGTGNRNTRGAQAIPASVKVFYWLARRTVHKPDPTLMPSGEELADAAIRAVRQMIEARRGAADTGEAA